LLVRDSLLVLYLHLEVLLLREAALPALLPGADEIVEEPALEVQTWPDADGEVVEIHAVAVLVREEKREVACDCEEEVVVEWWEVGQGILELLWYWLSQLLIFGIVVCEIFAEGEL
jgi:hypothetical protein